MSDDREFVESDLLLEELIDSELEEYTDACDGAISPLVWGSICQPN